MESGWVLLGRELETFETEYAASVGVKHCVGVANGLEAMQLVLMALGIGPGDEVIVPSHGYIATWLAVTQVGAKPVPCEPDPRTYNLDPARIAALILRIRERFANTSLWSDRRPGCNQRGRGAIRLFVLEDAAQSLVRCTGAGGGEHSAAPRA